MAAPFHETQPLHEHEDVAAVSYLLPPRLTRQGGPRQAGAELQFWMAAQPRPEPEQKPFHEQQFLQEPPFHEQHSVQDIIAAASCLLDEHWEILDEAARDIRDSGCQEDEATKAVSVLLAASYRETKPHPLVVGGDIRKITDRVVAAVCLLITCDKGLLTAAARRVLLDEPRTHGELWVMEVIKTAFRLADVPHHHEKLSGPAGKYGVLSMLRVEDVRDAEEFWLGPHEGWKWPYEEVEIQYILQSSRR